MKKIKILGLFICLFTFYGCPYQGPDDGPFIDEASLYSPVILSRSDFENSISVSNAIPINKAGKIYIKNDILFINEINQGFHVFDNSNPNNPQNIAFIKVLGSKDLAVKGDVIYVHNATDLIALKPNYTNLSFQLTKRVRNTFPQITSPDGFYYTDLGEDEIIVDWILND